MKSSLLKKTGLWKAAFVLAALAAWVSIPFVTGDTVKAGDSTPIATRFANLVSPTGSVNPHGDAEWELYASGHRELEVEIEDVNTLPAGTVLTVVVDGNNAGQMVLATDQRARLRLRTQDGQTVPPVNDGSTVQVRNGANVLVAGTFSGGGGGTPTPSPTGTVTPSPSPTGTVSPSPSPTGTGTPSPSPTVSPSPSPTGTPNAGDLFAALNGPTLNGAIPMGYAQFEIHSSRTELEIEVRQVNLPLGTSLGVVVNGVAVGNLVLTEAGGRGELRLRSDRGQTVPQVVAGSTIGITNGGTTVLSGIFRGFTGPSPSPSPTASPTPGLGRSFEAHLLGSGTTPPVTTNATGEIKVTLNATETQATVFGEFHNLSSNQTGARIEAMTSTVVTIRNLGVVGGNNGNFALTTFDVTPAQVQQLRAGLWSAVITSVNHPNGEIRGSFRQRSGGGDFDGDGSNDVAVFRPSTGVWYAQNASGVTAQLFGAAGDVVVSADYDGDGRTDSAVFRSVNGAGVWYILRSSDGGVSSTQFGFASDVPVRGDFDGDGRNDVAVYRPSTGVWYVQKSDNSGYIIMQFGISEDRPMPMDLDGDGRDDVAVFRPSTGTWYWLRSSNGQFSGAQFGQAGDVPVQGDFDGDGKDDISVFRPSSGVWYTLKSSDGGFTAIQWGQSGDVPVPGTYDADGKTDIAVFRPSTGMWYILRSSDGSFLATQFGLNGDVPVAAK